MTYFRSWVRKRHLTFKGFHSRWQEACKKLAMSANEPRLAGVTITRRTFERWMSGEARPRPDAARVLEFMTGLPVEALFAPASTGDATQLPVVTFDRLRATQESAPAFAENSDLVTFFLPPAMVANLSLLTEAEEVALRDLLLAVASLTAKLRVPFSLDPPVDVRR